MRAGMAITWLIIVTVAFIGAVKSIVDGNVLMTRIFFPILIVGCFTMAGLLDDKPLNS